MSVSLTRALLRLYPAAFRSRFGREIEQLVQDEPAAQPEVGRGLGHGGICYTFRERGARRRRRR